MAQITEVGTKVLRVPISVEVSRISPVDLDVRAQISSNVIFFILLHRKRCRKSLAAEPRNLSVEAHSGDNGKHDLYFRNISINSTTDA